MTEKFIKWLTVDRLIMLIGWAITIGIGIQQVRQVQKELEKQRDLWETQLVLNGKYEIYFELDFKNSDNENGN